MSKPWHSTGMSPSKDRRMDMTQENFYRIIAMHDEVIFEQRDTIAKLKMTINKLRLKKEKAMLKPWIYFHKGYWHVSAKPSKNHIYDLPWGNAHRFVWYLNNMQGKGHE